MIFFQILSKVRKQNRIPTTNILPSSSQLSSPLSLWSKLQKITIDFRNIAYLNLPRKGDHVTWIIKPLSYYTNPRYLLHVPRNCGLIDNRTKLVFPGAGAVALFTGRCEYFSRLLLSLIIDSVYLNMSCNTGYNTLCIEITWTSNKGVHISI